MSNFFMKIYTNTQWFFTHATFQEDKVIKVYIHINTLHRRIQNTQLSVTQDASNHNGYLHITRVVMHVVFQGSIIEAPHSSVDTRPMIISVVVVGVVLLCTAGVAVLYVYRRKKVSTRKNV